MEGQTPPPLPGGVASGTQLSLPTRKAVSPLGLGLEGQFPAWKANSWKRVELGVQGEVSLPAAWGPQPCAPDRALLAQGLGWGGSASLSAR